MSEEEKKAIEILTSWYNYNKKNRNKLLEADKIIKVQETILNLIEKQQTELNNLKEIEKEHQEENGKLRVELEKYKRLAEMNLKDAEEFQENMCEHRCILYNEIEELKTELFEEKEKNKKLEKENKELQKYEEVYKLLSYALNNYISKDKIKEKIDMVATIMYEQSELDYEDIRDTITECISRIKKALLEV